MNPNIPFAVLVAVGPDERELERLKDLIAALAHHERAATLVMVDDAPEPRDLSDLPAPPGVKLIALPSQRNRQLSFRAGKGICSPVMTALTWAARQPGLRFAVKLDTDSLVIASFSERLATLFDRNASVGMIGAYSRSPGGGRRDWSVHSRPLRSLTRHPLLRAALRRPLPAPAAATGHARALFNAARRHGYVLGEHCLGGGYAISGDTLRALNSAGWLDSAALWATIDLPEDVMVGMHVRAVGHGFCDDVEEGGVFGVRHIGLPFPPATLVERGYGIIHAVKNDEMSEGEIRAFFAARRDV